MRIVILAAGVGSRLQSPVPKPLTVLDDGRSILERQLSALQGAFPTVAVTTVVGFKKDLIMEACPQCSFVYNPDYGDTNTSKSLLRALKLTGDDPVLWLNGDVVFDAPLLDVLAEHIAADQSFVAVNTASVGDEEVKYELDDHGHITNISKEVTEALGEAVGINYVSKADKPLLEARLADCDDQDYFERGIELSIGKDGCRYIPVDVSDFLCMEIDTRADLSQVNRLIDGS